MLIDPDTGQVRFVILEVGGFLGLGATRVAVPLSAFQITQEGNTSKWVLDADKEKLTNAPKVEGKNHSAFTLVRKLSRSLCTGESSGSNPSPVPIRDKQTS